MKKVLADLRKAFNKKITDSVRINLGYLRNLGTIFLDNYSLQYLISYEDLSRNIIYKGTCGLHKINRPFKIVRIIGTYNTFNLNSTFKKKFVSMK